MFFSKPYLKTKDIFFKNSSPKELWIKVFYADHEPIETYLHINPVSPDTDFDPESIRYNFWPEYHGAVKKIRFTIWETFPGTKYDDTCISEIKILVG
ncbi:MAG: hypothetical protein A2Y33_13615 [Spirochaetes bacterium GWF1_51_8]|nr:MAG: hypothetical protein A2Y33_13615 [Spirochaetes bacterium GWF1_51_8]